MKIVIFVYLILLSYCALSQDKDTTFKCYRLELIEIKKHEKEEFDVYVFKNKNQKISINSNYIVVYVDSFQNTPFEYNGIKMKQLTVGSIYNICLRKLYYYDWTKKKSFRSEGYRGMDIYSYKDSYGDVYITHDIQNGKILKRKRNDTIDYFKRKPMYLHGYGAYPG